MTAADEEEPTTPVAPPAEEGNETVGVVPTGGEVTEGEVPPPSTPPPVLDPEPTAPPGEPTETVGEPWNP